MQSNGLGVLLILKDLVKILAFKVEPCFRCVFLY